MKNKIISIAAFTLVSTFWLSCIFVGTGAADEKKKAEAIMAAEDFLLLIDTAQYGKSWDASSSLFQGQVPKDTWIQQISAIRSALGKLNKREIINAQYMTTLPGAPDGEYVVIQYESSFDSKQNGVETVTPMLDKDAQWRVSGYYIR